MIHGARQAGASGARGPWSAPSGRTSGARPRAISRWRRPSQTPEDAERRQCTISTASVPTARWATSRRSTPPTAHTACTGAAPTGSTGACGPSPRTTPCRCASTSSADCASPGHDCRDRFRLEMYESSGSDHSQGFIWIYRWSGTEHSRWLDSSIGRRGVLILADDPDAVVPGYERRANEAFDRLLESRGRPPDRLVAAAAGAHSGRLSITLTMPRLCRSGSFREDNGLPVRWEVEGGAPPLRRDDWRRSLRRPGGVALDQVRIRAGPGAGLGACARSRRSRSTAGETARPITLTWSSSRRFLPGHWQVEHLTAGPHLPTGELVRHAARGRPGPLGRSVLRGAVLPACGCRRRGTALRLRHAL